MEKRSAADQATSYYLGIELGSTRIKACLIDGQGQVQGSGAAQWENQLVDGHWSYTLESVWSGLQAAYRDLQTNYPELAVEKIAGMGISGMMHGYLAFDQAGKQLVPFRTWRDTYTQAAAQELSQTFGVNVPLRWSIAHYYQALLDREAQVKEVDFFTTLSGYVHWQLTGEKVLGIGDAVGMFPISPQTHTYDQQLIRRFDDLAAAQGAAGSVRDKLPQVLVAGQNAGCLTAAGAKLLDPSGKLPPGIPFCPPEGDAGTGMVATNAVAPRSGNVSVGTSIFAMIVLEGPLKEANQQIDPVTTPAGDPVAMVHCNNGAAEIATWIELISQAVKQITGQQLSSAQVYAPLLAAALQAEKSAAGVVVYNYLSGEPVTGIVAEGRPLLARQPASELNLANFMRAQLFGVFASLALGMRALDQQGVAVDRIYAHGGLFKTPQVAQRILAAAMNTPVYLAASAAEGGAWGIALLAAFAQQNKYRQLAEYLAKQIFTKLDTQVQLPERQDRAGFLEYLSTYQAGLKVEQAAIQAWPLNSTGE